MLRGTAKCTNRNVDAGLPRHGHGAWRGRMAKLPMTSAGPSEHPTVVLEHPDETANLHRITSLPASLQRAVTGPLGDFVAQADDSVGMAGRGEQAQGDIAVVGGGKGDGLADGHSFPSIRLSQTATERRNCIQVTISSSLKGTSSGSKVPVRQAFWTT